MALTRAIAKSVGSAPPDGVLVMNTIDDHYTSLIAAWARMVRLAPFRKQIFVVAMDRSAANACEDASIPHFAPPARERPSRSASGCLRDRQSPAHEPGAAPAPGTYKRVKIQGKDADTRILPPDLPSWKMRGVLAGLELGW